MKRKLSLYSVLLVITIICGLLSRSSLIPMPQLISTYAGDTLWAMMLFWIFCCLRPKASTLTVALLTMTFAFCIEFSQLYHANWIDVIRHTRVGALVLGFGFKFSDLICYVVGILIAAVIDVILVHNMHKTYNKSIN
ncbi:MAG: DUF2809 domain-containing protein [Saccharospirillaceae bacterium]|nr:DUF2809 domain-containing protein [Pseudomonadales bacterium]NRB77564.1 DUF2809 domain-containing protein [Saccharospirillaceae bacterium]